MWCSVPEQAAPAEYRAPFLSKLPKSSRIKFGQGTGNGACIARGRAVYNGIIQNGGASAPGAGNRDRSAAGGYPPVLRIPYGGQKRCVQTKIGTYRRNEQ